MIDLRSDTVTRPSLGMREAMMSAPVGDDVYRDDETMNEFEEKVAKLFGKEDGVFTPTGSLSNQLSIRTLVKPGEEWVPPLLCTNKEDAEQAEEIINMSDADRQRWMSKLSDSDFKKAREVLFKAALG